MFLKQDLGGPAPDLKHAPAAAKASGPAPRFYGAYGYAPATQPSQQN